MFTAAAVLWVASLFFDSIGASGGPTLRGFDVLLQGAGGWRYGVFAWYANPLLIAGIAAALAGYRYLGLALFVVCLVLAVSSFWSSELARAAGRSVPELSIFPGLYIWLAACFAALFGGIYYTGVPKRLD